MPRSPMIVLPVVVLVFVLAACDGAQPTPMASLAPDLMPTSTPFPVHTSGPTITPTLVLALTPMSAPDLAPIPTPTPLPHAGDLGEDIPPCTPVPDSPVDPCELDAPSVEMSVASYIQDLGDEPWSIREMLDDEPSAAWVTHLVVCGTYLPNTVRCTTGDLFRPAAHLRSVFGTPTIERSYKCYIDVRANSYILGSGPSTLTVMFFIYPYYDGGYNYDLEEGQTEQDVIEEIRQNFEDSFVDIFAGREHVIFLAPPADLSSEVWRRVGSWDVQRKENGAVIAIHPSRDLWRRLRPDDYPTHRDGLEMTLPALTKAITTAHQTRLTEYEGRIGENEDLPNLVSNANDLRDYYIEVGAYDDPDNPPAQPPPPCGLAVPNQTDNPGLMQDCIALFAVRDTLRGTATLNWSVDTPIADWDGVTVEGTPGRVSKLHLYSRGLTGSIPPELADLTGLTSLWLYRNRLTGGIPSELAELSGLTVLQLYNNRLSGGIPGELGGLSNLETLWLSGNGLTGCVPPALRDVDDNDLGLLGLPDCAPE